VIEWWQGLAPAQSEVDCAGNRHRLRWENGTLDALDHGDVESERTLASLAGETCTCLDLVEAWDHHRDDLRVLVLGSRGPTDIVAAQQAELGVTRRRRSGAGVARAGASGPVFLGPVQTAPAMGSRSSRATARMRFGRLPQPPDRESQNAHAENELLALLGLGGRLPERLVATVAAAWKERLQHRPRPTVQSRAQLQAALHGRVLAAMSGWLGASGPKSKLVMIGERRTPKLMQEADRVRVELPFGWLVDVWAQGLATIWGRFCLSASTDDGRTWRLTTVGQDLGSPSVITLQLGT
jgi:hypothetical protein